MHPTTGSLTDVSNAARGHDVPAQIPPGSLQVVEITRDVLDDLLSRAEALAGQQIRRYEERSNSAGCLECLRCGLHGGPIEHTGRCLTGGMLAATQAVRTQLERTPAAPAWYYVPLANPATAEAPAEYMSNSAARSALFPEPSDRGPVALLGEILTGAGISSYWREKIAEMIGVPYVPLDTPPERRVVCGDMVTDRSGGVHICDEEPEHSGWHIDRGHGKAWPSLVAWALERTPVCDAAEIGLL